jgi:ribosomal protein L37AE/L43A
MPSRVTNLITNRKTGKATKRVHHCPECKRPSNNHCLKQLHQAYCEECGYMFAVKSRGGCIQHKYRDGYNKNVLNERRALDPTFNHEDADDEQKEEPAKPFEYKPFNTNWSKSDHKAKANPKEKTADRQGRKQQPAMDVNAVKRERKTRPRGA